MSVIDRLRRLIAPSTSGLICPHCEKPLGESHDEQGCRRGMSRRYFFGMSAAAVAAAAVAPAAMAAGAGAVHPLVDVGGRVETTLAIIQNPGGPDEKVILPDAGGYFYLLATKNDCQGVTRVPATSFGEKDAIEAQIAALKRAGFHVAISDSEAGLRKKRNDLKVPSIVGL